MRITLLRLCQLAAAAALAACAQQPAQKTPPAPVVEASTPATSPSAPAPQPAPKPKPKPKPVAPKAETSDTDVTPAPPAGPTPAEGIERAQVGYYFDTLQGRLRQVADPNIVVTRNDGHITVDITRRVSFGDDDAPLPAGACAALAPIAKALIEYKMTRIVAEAGASSADTSALKSAKAHSAAIAKCLADSGVAGHRLGTREHVASSAPSTVLRIEPIVK